MSQSLPRFPVIMGPTASGKSDLALKLAELFDGEIVSADSMQLYRGLDKGTAKPSPAERAAVPHHLIDVLDISEKSDLFSYVTKAENAIRKIRQNGHLPIVCGGTGLYLRSLLYGLDDVPADPKIRKELDEQFDSPEGHLKLLEIMKKKCPHDAELWKDHPRRLLRAYEVFLISGKEMADHLRAWHEKPQRKDAVAFLLVWDRAELNKRIYERCLKMLDSGWIEETSRLERQGLFETPTAKQALGYPVIRDFLHGQIKRTELCEQISIATRQFARRQMTWFTGQHKEAIQIRMPCKYAEATEFIIRQCRKKAR